jgi:ABC-type multidrug transport system ATPase subunit
MNTSSKPPVIQVNNLTKVYDKQPAVKNLNLNVRKGEIFGFLGPNGAGKTTTIKAILGLIFANRGNININGNDIHKHTKYLKKFIGYLPERVAFYDNLTALQNLQFYAELKNVSKSECNRLINELGLKESSNKKAGRYSKGMLPRHGMARAILGTPPILILDEPSGGLDPRGVKLIRDKIKQLNKMGVTIFISSHILSEIQAVCTQVGIINKGVLVAQDTVGALSKNLQIKPKIKLEITNLTEKIKQIVQKVEGVDKIEIINHSLEVFCLPELRAKVVFEVYKAGGKIVNLQTEEASLEDVFMRFTEG